MKNNPRLDIEQVAGRWAWKLIDGQHSVLAISGRSFTSKRAALEGINDTLRAIKATREVYAETDDVD